MTRSASTLARVAMLIGTSLAGCGHSPATHYVRLNASPSGALLATTRIAPVQLTAVHIPTVLDRPEVVTQVSPNRLTVDDRNHWGAPLAQMMRGTLAQDLTMRLPAGAFVFPDAPAPPDTRTLVVTVLDAEADTKTMTFQAGWTLLSGQPPHVTLTREVTLTSTLTSRDAAEQAAALSRILGELADRIVASIVER
ncbi:PqiC family protein [Paraburkholderia phymatum]|uniref:ABC-type transport auxiliary lipoprotein component domain-containing protein n=1 Tax=Paraburkholderia phymatum (strain DSM 17167 / CIP 108236 / LMG 21445 / STM815) TaxID=391038 RepID=B2JMU7_PARP8|nr:PqiC family protein [Paraburkholderia phymatum]ACC74340.1 protein of unknown function DUF330 [Paraburkholderia phymatum STM815]